jgi:peptidoglycan/LPS O-acetylase OafA/YrhL
VGRDETAGQQREERFYVLDGFRGIVALVVVCYHLGVSLGGLPRPAHAVLAVDFFFLLSGFVIDHAYDRRLAAGLSACKFLRMRLIRLYPLYFLALVLGIGKLAIQARVGEVPPSGATLLGDALRGLFLFPAINHIGVPPALVYPAVIPAWSLIFELVVNVGYATWHRRWTTPVLVGVVAVSGVALVVARQYYGSMDLGAGWDTFPGAVPRAMFSFFLGVLLHRHRPSLRALGSWGFVGLNLGLVVLFGCDLGVGSSLYDFGCVVVLFPVILLAGAATQIGGWLKGLCSLAGDASYAIYIVHFPVFMIVAGILRRVPPEIGDSVVVGPVFLGLIVAGAVVLARGYDLPARRWLTGRFGGPRREGRSDAMPAV